MILLTAQVLMSNNGLAAELGRSSGGGLEFQVFCGPRILDMMVLQTDRKGGNGAIGSEFLLKPSVILIQFTR